MDTFEQKSVSKYRKPAQPKLRNQNPDPVQPTLQTPEPNQSNSTKSSRFQTAKNGMLAAETSFMVTLRVRLSGAAFFKSSSHTRLVKTDFRLPGALLEKVRPPYGLVYFEGLSWGFTREPGDPLPKATKNWQRKANLILGRAHLSMQEGQVVHQPTGSIPQDQRAPAPIPLDFSTAGLGV